MTTDSAAIIEAFIDRWGPSGGGERSNYQMFLTELCTLIGAPTPEPAVQVESQNKYVFERTVPARRIDGKTTTNYIDLYKRGCFVLEAKQSTKRLKQYAELKQLDLGITDQRTGSGQRGGAQWDTLMRNAREQAEGYAKRLPTDEGWPPFLVIVDVGHVIELFADFSLQGKHYAQFPDRQSYRIFLEDLRDAKVRERLRLVWEDPDSLNPAKRTAEVTREIAALLAKLSKSLETRMIRALPTKLEADKQVVEKRAIAEKTSMFLMRCLFTMFAEDVDLLPKHSFTGLLKEYVGKADKIHVPLQRLWNEMDKGGFSPELRADVMKFNGGLFKGATALPITEEDLNWLTIAAEREWQDVEPAIFGTLLEGALDPAERHQLGAHYTPRAYVERLVVATVIEPLQADWRDVQAAAAQLTEAGDAKEARTLVRTFHDQLCALKILDPACGTGNFLYVTMELMKRLEGEILETLTDLGEKQDALKLAGHTVDPHQFLGLELNPRAVAIAELVLWIGHLQWHFRTYGKTMPAEPVLRNFHNIVEQDAVLKFDTQEILRDNDGRAVTRWDGVTYSLHPITGEEVPDEKAQTPLYTYSNPRPATWPEADFIVGNPPFIGNKRMRSELGDGYVDALRGAHKTVPKSVDFVMYWWNQSALLVRANKVRGFGFVTTNSITMTFNQKVIEPHLIDNKTPLSITFAISDHPWQKAADKAAVRIAMTVAAAGTHSGRIGHVISEDGLNTDTPNILVSFISGKILSDLTCGASLNTAQPLHSNENLSYMGVIPVGLGFVIEGNELSNFAGSSKAVPSHIKKYMNGKELTKLHQSRYIIDFFGLSLDEARKLDPRAFQQVINEVLPFRNKANRKNHRENWWIFGETRPGMRKALGGLFHYIATPETAKHRWFTFLKNDILPDQKIRVIASDSAYLLGILSSNIHVSWSIAVGARIGQGNDPVYNT
ncbi:MAG: class I SAM-dependent DNA methyltransferase, partial [Alphaproteobacteria bacterium]|nr:class I SAM-dependent DNA methyltransferase [Alphaproteobacteria bacterium]